MERMAIQWTARLPLVTKIWLGSVISTALFLTAGIIKEEDTVFVPSLVWKGRQYWRIPFSISYFGGFDIELVQEIYRLVSFVSALEESMGLGEFLWFLSLTLSGILLITTWLDQAVLLSRIAMMTLVFFWAKRKLDDDLVLYGLIRVKSSHYCLIVMFSYIFSKRYLELSSLLVGFALYYIYDVMPLIHGFNLLGPPWQLWENIKENKVRRQRIRKIQLHSD